MTGKESALFVFLLLNASGEVCGAQTARPLPQWLSGIISVSLFLLLVFIGFLVKKIWCNGSETSLGRSMVSEATQGDLYERDLDFFENKHAVDVTDDVVARGGLANMYEKSLDVLRRWSKEERETVIDSGYEMSLDVIRTEKHSNADSNVSLAPGQRSTVM